MKNRSFVIRFVSCFVIIYGGANPPSADRLIFDKKQLYFMRKRMPLSYC